MTRARQRDRAGRGASDATASVVDQMHRRFEPLDEVAPGAQMAPRTDRIVADVVEDILAILDRRLGRSSPPNATQETMANAAGT